MQLNVIFRIRKLGCIWTMYGLVWPQQGDKVQRGSDGGPEVDKTKTWGLGMMIVANILAGKYTELC